MQRLRFSSVNLEGQPDFDEAMVRHHVVVRETRRYPQLNQFLDELRPFGFHIDDFLSNGVMLPATPSRSEASGLPLHRCGHPFYNVQVIEEVERLRRACKPIRSPGQRALVASVGIRALRSRILISMRTLGPKPLNAIVLSGMTDGDLDALYETLLARRARTKKVRP